MGRFVEEADRGQWTLLPECLDDFIDEVLLKLSIYGYLNRVQSSRPCLQVILQRRAVPASHRCAIHFLWL